MSDESSFASAPSVAAASAAAIRTARQSLPVHRELPLPPNSTHAANLELLVSIELGRVKLPLAEIAGLEDGAILQLDKRANEPLDIVINEQLVARGEVVVVGGRFAVRIVEVMPAHRTLD